MRLSRPLRAGRFQQQQRRQCVPRLSRRTETSSARTVPLAARRSQLRVVCAARRGRIHCGHEQLGPRCVLAADAVVARIDVVAAAAGTAAAGTGGAYCARGGIEPERCVWHGIVVCECVFCFVLG